MLHMTVHETIKALKDTPHATLKTDLNRGMIEKKKQVNIILSGYGLDLSADHSLCIKQFAVEPGLPTSSISCAVVNTFIDNMAYAQEFFVLLVGWLY